MVFLLGLMFEVASTARPAAGPGFQPVPLGPGPRGTLAGPGRCRPSPPKERAARPGAGLGLRSPGGLRRPPAGAGGCRVALGATAARRPSPPAAQFLVPAKGYVAAGEGAGGLRGRALRAQLAAGSGRAVMAGRPGRRGPGEPGLRPRRRGVWGQTDGSRAPAARWKGGGHTGRRAIAAGSPTQLLRTGLPNCISSDRTFFSVLRLLSP